MLTTRVIPTLLLKNDGLYKGIKFKNHKYVGDPVNTIKLFNDKEVDELVVLDITASIESRGPDFELITEMASEAFMPMAYGGGLRKMDDADRVFSVGFEKIVVSTSLYENPDFVSDTCKKYGSQSVVASIDYSKPRFGHRSPVVFARCATKKQRLSPQEATRRAVDLGVGEILLNCIDRDGTMLGYDLEMIADVAKGVDVPVIASGGAASIDDFVLAKRNHASAVAAGAMFVYQGPHRAVLIQYPAYRELENALGDSGQKE